MTPRTGSPEQFAALRQFLAESSYTAPAIRERLEIPSLSKIVHLRPGGPRADALDWLIRLFLLEETLPQSWIPAGIFAVLQGLGLVSGEGGVTATVKLYPVESVYVISDRDQSGRTGPDHVFSAISPQTEEFLRFIPESRCPACLEICSGAGAAALLAASRYATQAFAFDISERCRLFADFSRRLNGIGNLTVKQGDLYAPAGRQTFDRILAHPPYVPALRGTQLFRDGGEDGEQLTRRIVEGLPNYLHPGGRLYLLAMFAEYPGNPIPDRIRQWLRDAQSEFDLVVVLRARTAAGTFLFDNCAPEDLPAWRQFVEQRRIRNFRYADVIVERHRENKASATVLREAGEGYVTADAERCLPPLELREELRPRTVPGLECASRSRLEDGRWLATNLVLRQTGPFRIELPVEGWVPDLIARCDGTRTIAELGHASLIAELAGAGILEVE